MKKKTTARRATKRKAKKKAKANPVPVLVAMKAARKVARKIRPNPPALPKALRKPLVLVLSKEESAKVQSGGVTAAMVRDALAAARASGRKGWDHIEVQHPGGGHAFDLAP